MSVGVECLLWLAVFRAAGPGEKIAGFSESSYLAYALWAPFIGRITSNWMYEFRMAEEIENGTINSLLVRPFSFFEYYLSQLLGYKIITTLVSLMNPLAFAYVFQWPFDISRLPLTLFLVIYYVLFLHVMSFGISTVAFRLTKTHSLTMAKNLALWCLSGELFPLDLFPPAIKSIVVSLPFSNAVFIPVGYLTGRLESDAILNGFASITAGILVLLPITIWSWKSGLKNYSGTGA